MDMFAPHQLQLDYSPISDMNNSTSSHQSPYVANTMGEHHFQDNFQDFNTNVDFSLYDNEDLYSANVQLPTPSHEIFQNTLGSTTFDTSGIPFGADPMPHISPVGQGNTMLYTPTSLREVDEGFEDFVPNNCNHGGTADFQLFPSSTGGTVASSAPSALFGEIPANNFPGVSAQELLDFYIASTHAAIHGGANMDWSSDDQFSGYERH